MESNLSQDVLMREVFQRKVGAFELLDRMDKGKYGQCIECSGELNAPKLLTNTGYGHYSDGPVLCAWCKSTRNRRLQAELNAMGDGE